MAWAISASKRSKTGSPQPTGTFSATISSFAPQLVPCSRKDVTKASKRGTASASPQKNGLFGTSFQSSFSAFSVPI